MQNIAVGYANMPSCCLPTPTLWSYWFQDARGCRALTWFSSTASNISAVFFALSIRLGVWYGFPYRLWNSIQANLSYIASSVWVSALPTLPVCGRSALGFCPWIAWYSSDVGVFLPFVLSCTMRSPRILAWAVSPPDFSSDWPSASMYPPRT